MDDMNREAWLQAAGAELSTYLKQVTGKVVPPFHVSVGWPFTSPRKRLAECWHSKASADGVNQIFISPVLDTERALISLVHELCHVYDGCENGHGKGFIDYARPAGLMEPWAASTAGDELNREISRIIEELPEYPHSIMAMTEKQTPQATRMKKLECPECGYVVRTTQKWLDVGVPSCPAGDELVLK